MTWEELHKRVRAVLQPARGTWPKNGEYRYFCPFHEDRRNPNLDINVEKGAYICRACGKAGKLTHLARELGIEVRSGGNSELGDADAEWLLRKHGISPETATFFDIKPNFKAQAWQYPVFDWRTKECLGHRYKAYNSRAGRKYWEDGGIGAQVYLGRIEGPVVYLAEGEKDTWILAQAGLPGACITGGATAIADDLSEALRSNGIEEVRIIYDLDGVGREGAQKVMDFLGDAFTVKVLQLPKNLGKGGDIADLYRMQGEKFKETVENLPVTSVSKKKYDESGIIAKVADKGFLKSYVEYCADKTDAPYTFHLAVGLSVLGAALGNQVVIPCFYGDLELYPNLWIVLVAPTGFYRKSTALSLGKRLLRTSVPKGIMPDDWTPQKLAHMLQDNPAGLMTISEFTRVLATFGREYMAGTKEMLTEMYDSPEEWILERQTSKKVTIRNVSLSILGATTLAWLQDRVKARDLEGGFLARFLFVAGTERGARPKNAIGRNHQVYAELQNHLKAVAELEGNADYSLVEQDLRDWVYNYERLAEQGAMSPELVGMYARTGTTVQKLALIFQVSMNPPSLNITPEAAEKAKALIEYVHQETSKVTRSFADGWFGRQLVRARQFIEGYKEVTREELFRYMQIEARKLNSVIETLKEEGSVEVGKGESTGGRPPMVYRWKGE